ncbi:MAG: hypothetical protein ACR2LT_07780 [Pyrinomonadaceae bacterium]
MKIRQSINSALVFLLLLTIFETVQINAQISQKKSRANTSHQQNLQNLKTWVGKYPFDKKSKRYANFFNEPQVRFLLTDLLGNRKKYQQFVSEFRNLTPIEFIEGFLVIQGTEPMPPAGQGVEKHILVAIKLKDKETHIVFVKNDKHWGLATTSEDLPDDISKKIDIYQFGYQPPTPN